jgi:protoporphyrinogen oxidase
MQSVDFLIVGGGVTGLGSATRIGQISDKTWLMVEKESDPGGLSRTISSDGFRADYGGHVLASHCKYFDDLVQEAVGPYSGPNWSNLKRVSHVIMEDGGEVRKVPYPFQKNLKFLSDKSMKECLQGLINRDQRVPPENFKEWILANFGEGIADKFMMKYNFKVWGHPPEMMAHDWVSDRVAEIDAYESVKSVIEDGEDSQWGPNNLFNYPLKGTGEIYKKIAGLLPSENQMYNTSVDKIDRENRVATLSNGTQLKFNFLISTMPLDILMPMVGMEPDTNKLRHSSTNVILFGFEGKCPNGESSWMYFPSEDVPFYRATVFSNYSPENTPDPEKYYSLMLEVSESAFKPVDQETLVMECLDACTRMGMVSDGSKLVKTMKERAEYGYPTPCVGTRDYVRETRKELKKSGIYSAGRFGAYMYSISNQDGALMQGVQSVDNALYGATESWIETPEFQTGRYDVDMTYP